MVCPKGIFFVCVCVCLAVSARRINEGVDKQARLDGNADDMKQSHRTTATSGGLTLNSVDMVLEKIRETLPNPNEFDWSAVEAAVNNLASPGPGKNDASLLRSWFPLLRGKSMKTTLEYYREAFEDNSDLVNRLKRQLTWQIFSQKAVQFYACLEWLHANDLNRESELVAYVKGLTAPNPDRILRGILAEEFGHVYDSDDPSRRIGYFQKLIARERENLYLRTEWSINPIQKDRFKKKLSETYELNKTDTEFFNTFIDSIQIVTFKRFLDGMVKALTKASGGSPYVLIVEASTKGRCKSNQWAPLLALDIAWNKEKVASRFPELREGLETVQGPDDIYVRPPGIGVWYERELIGSIKHWHGRKFVYVDDAAYSGQQMVDFASGVRLALEAYGSKLSIALGAGTRFAEQKLSQKGYSIHVGTYLRTFAEVDEKGLFEKQYLKYTKVLGRNPQQAESARVQKTVDVLEHKLADDISTYDSFILGAVNDVTPRMGGPDGYRYIGDRNITYLLDGDRRTLLAGCVSIDPAREGQCMKAFYKNSLKSLDLSEIYYTS